MNSKALAEILAEEAYRFQFEKMTLWEERLRLILRPKPRWVPLFVWRWMVQSVVYQEHTKKELRKL